MAGRTPGSKNARMHRFTDEEKTYLESIVSGRSHRDLTTMMNERFGLALAVDQVKAAISRYGLNTGRTGCFAPGHVPANKGRLGYCAPGSEKGWFAPGGFSHNRVEIGTEKQRSDGYVWVKVADGRKNANWRQKHILIWEAANGAVPQGSVVMFRNGDTTDCRIENLILTDKATVARFNHMRLPVGEGVTEAGLLVAAIGNRIGQRRRKQSP
jgi:hypothetical protein